MKPPKRKPIPTIAEALEEWKSQSGIKKRLEQAEIVVSWAELMGPQIAAVTRAEGITPDGVLRVRVATAAWAQELRLMTPRLIARMNAGRKGRVEQIRWTIGPLDDARA